MIAQERLYLTADRSRLVGEGDKLAAFLFCVKGQEVHDSEAAKYGLSKPVTPPATEKQEPAPQPETRQIRPLRVGRTR